MASEDDDIIVKAVDIAKPWNCMFLDFVCCLGEGVKFLTKGNWNTTAGRWF